jgi:hypothetical protein
MLRSRTRSPTFDRLTVDPVGDIGRGDGGDLGGDSSSLIALLPRPYRSISSVASCRVVVARLRDRVLRPSRDLALELARPVGPLLLSRSRGLTGSEGEVSL